MTDAPRAMTQAEYARHKGWNKGYVTRLKQAGRLVMMEDGKVDVEATEKRLAETAQAAPANESLAEAKARKERALADLAEMEAKQKRGQLIPRDAVVSVLRDAATVIRVRFEALPDQLAPVLAPLTALEDIHAMLAEAVRAQLADVAETIKSSEDELAG